MTEIDCAKSPSQSPVDVFDTFNDGEIYIMGVRGHPETVAPAHEVANSNLSLCMAPHLPVPLRAPAETFTFLAGFITDNGLIHAFQSDAVLQILKQKNPRYPQAR